MKRRRLLQLGLGLGTLGLLTGAERFFVARFARPAAATGPLSAKAAALLEKAWNGLDPKRVLDCHAHIVGLGTGGTGAFVTPRMMSPLTHPVQYARFEIYTRAASIDDLAHADQEYVTNLVAHIRAQAKHGRMTLLPLDRVHREDGTVNVEATEIYASNDYALQLAAAHPDCFVAAASIHPYREDAVTELERVAAAGAVLVKWLPNAQQIDPSNPKCDAFYEKLAALGMPLLAHAGQENAVESGAQDFGNPLHLRRPLEHGVKVIVAHTAGLGTSDDLDAPGDVKPRVPCFELFLRLAHDPVVGERVYADISAVTQSNRCGHLPELLRRTEIHGRLVYGTDYPLAAINGLVRTEALVGLGLLTEDEREALNEIDRHNPLTFDLALKRTLALTEGGRTFAFAPEIFHHRPELMPRVQLAPA